VTDRKVKLSNFSKSQYENLISIA